MNKVILMGRLTKDPEVRYAQGSEPLAVARYTLAVNRRFKRQGEQDADFIFFVHRPAYYDPKLNPKDLKFFVAKSRHTGGNKYFTLSYDAQTQTITDLGGETPEPYQQLDFNGAKYVESIQSSK